MNIPTILRYASAALLLTIGTSRAGIIGYAGGGTPAGLYQIDPSTGSAILITPVQPFLSSGGLAYMSGLLYATNYTPNPGTTPPTEYGTVNSTTGAFSQVGSQGTSGNWYGLTQGPIAGDLYVYELESNTLQTFLPGQPITSSISVTGILNPGGIRGMAYDPIHQIMYATDYYDPTPHLYSINIQTGLATLIGALGLPPARFGGHVPLAFDPVSQILYAADDVSDSLFTLNTSTGAASLVGSSGSLEQPIGSMTWIATAEPSGVVLVFSSLLSILAVFRLSRLCNSVLWVAKFPPRL